MKINFDITKPEYDIIKDILVGYLPQDCKIWVFGSRSKNKTRFNSDLDLAIEYIEKLPQKTLYDLKEAFTQSRLPYTVDIVDMNNITTDFKQIIEKQAIEFPIEKTTTTPKIRFPEFAGAWEERKLGEVVCFLKGKNLSKDDIIIDGKYECVRYGELYTVYNEIINTVFSKTNLNPNENIISEYGDVLIPSSGETQIDIAKASCILKNGVILGGDLNILRGAENGAFISYYVNGNLKPKIAIMAQGNSVVHLYSSQLKNLKISLPSLPEQQKIADFLTAVDEKIGLLTKEHTLWQDYKKGMMQRIFRGGQFTTPSLRDTPPCKGGELRDKNSPPVKEGWQAKPDGVVRFTDENGNPYPDWEEKKLGEVITNKSKKFNPTKENTFIKCVELEHISSETGQLLGYTNGADAGSIKNKFKSGDVLFGKLRPYLRKYLKADFNGVCSSEIWVLTGLRISNDFLYQIVQGENFISLANLSSGSKMPRADWGLLKDRNIRFPSLPEQQKIADFLSAIDEKINLVKQQLDKTKEFKKGLLQKMFV